ncbi:hypothetical protein [Parafrankia sp. FMc2]|uniref:hypothetical protein n=1 Tax=Parafrankia sp. FMc2 TaxID=3233196 RepID=UPI0034D55FC7
MPIALYGEERDVLQGGGRGGEDRAGRHIVIADRAGARGGRTNAQSRPTWESTGAEPVELS